MPRTLPIPSPQRMMTTRNPLTNNELLAGVMLTEIPTADVTPAVADVDLDALRQGSADESSDEDLDRLDFRSRRTSSWSPKRTNLRCRRCDHLLGLFVSDGEPFDEVFDALVDEPSGAREVTAEASALVASPGARVGAIDVEPTATSSMFGSTGRARWRSTVRYGSSTSSCRSRASGSATVVSPSSCDSPLAPMAEGEQEGPDGAS